MTMQIATRHDLDHYLSDDATRSAALAHLQSLLDEQYGYDTAGAWTFVGGGGLERLGLTRAEAVGLGVIDRIIEEPQKPSSDRLETSSLLMEAEAFKPDLLWNFALGKNTSEAIKELQTTIDELKTALEQLE